MTLYWTSLADYNRFLFRIFYSWYTRLFFRQSHHHDIATAVDQTFHLVDFDPKDGYLEIQELTAGFHYMDKNGNVAIWSSLGDKIKLHKLLVNAQNVDPSGPSKDTQMNHSHNYTQIPKSLSLVIKKKWVYNVLQKVEIRRFTTNFWETWYIKDLFRFNNKIYIHIWL